MRIGRTYSSWTAQRLTTPIRERIRDAGEGTVDYGPATGYPTRFSACTVTTPSGSAWGVGPDPLAAFEDALRKLERVHLMTLLDGAA